MTNLKLSSKKHLFIIITAVIIAVGVAVGLICHFVAGGYFNAGEDYKSYKSVEVSYEYVDYKEAADVEKVCDGVFKQFGISYYSKINGNDVIEYRFSKSVADGNLQLAEEHIINQLNLGEKSGNNFAKFHTVNAEFTSSDSFVYASIAIATAVVFQFIYFAIRYKLTMAFSAMLANVHNLAVYVSLLAITRVPVGSNAVVFAAITVLLTIIGCCIYFDRYRKGLKEDDFKKLTAENQADTCAKETLFTQVVAAVGVAACAVVLFVLLSIGAMSVSAVLSPVICALLCAASAVYGTAFFTPSVYSGIKSIGDGLKAKRANKSSAK